MLWAAFEQFGANEEQVPIHEEFCLESMHLKNSAKLWFLSAKTFV